MGDMWGDYVHCCDIHSQTTNILLAILKSHKNDMVNAHTLKHQVNPDASSLFNTLFTKLKGPTQRRHL
jgi:hypothetical protein